jgi:hypothetical protein
VHYIAKKFGSNGMAEFEEEPKATIKDRQVMELQADTFAVDLGTTLRLNNGKVEVRFFTRKEDLEDWFFAIGSLMFIMGNSSNNELALYKNKIHPHPAIRLYNALESTKFYASKNSKEPISVIKDAWDFAANSIVDLIEEINFASPINYSLMNEYKELNDKLAELVNYMPILDEKIISYN